MNLRVLVAIVYILCLETLAKKNTPKKGPAKKATPKKATVQATLTASPTKTVTLGAPKTGLYI